MGRERLKQLGVKEVNVSNVLKCENRAQVGVVLIYLRVDRVI